jgi:hypothetical protein
MARIETPREAALRRIAEQQARVTKQKDLIAQLEANGGGTATVRQQLATMEDSLSALRLALGHLSD